MRLLALLVALAMPACTLEVHGESPSRERQPITAGEKSAFWSRFVSEDIVASFEHDDRGRPIAADYLAWTESFRQRSLVDMYEASGDVAFLDRLVQRADVVFALRDDRTKQRDVVRGRIMRAWGRYSDVGRDMRTDDWVCEMQQNGLITYPIAEFLRIADNDASLRARYGGKLDDYRARLVETVTEFDADWVDRGDEGFYVFPDGYARVFAPLEGRFLPYNRALAVGSTMAALIGTNVDSAQREKLRERVRKMARFFLRDARVDGSAYVWRHAPWTTAAEDVVHAGIDVEFIAATARVRESSVDDDDAMRFVASFKRFAREPGELDTEGACGRWLSLAAFDSTVTGLCKQPIARDRDPLQVAYARTLRYR